MFCFGPLSVIGLIHFLSAQTEYRLGHTSTALSKKRHAKAWSIFSWLFGLLVITIVLLMFYRVSLTSWREHGEVSRDRTTTIAAMLASKPVPYVAQLQYEMDKERKQRLYVPELQYEIEKERKLETTSQIYVAQLEYEMEREREEGKGQ